MRKSVARFMAIMAVAASLATSGLAQSDPGGWNSLVQTISTTEIRNASALNGREFVLSKPGIPASETLVLMPAEAFQVTRSGDTYRVRIVDVSKLVENVGPLLTRFRRVGWKSTSTSDTEFDLSLEGNGQCTSMLSFRQVGGDEINLTTAAQSYKLDFFFSDQARVKQQSVEGSVLRVNRVSGDLKALDVTLQMSLDGKVVGRSTPVAVPACAPVSNNPQAPILEARTPGQCMVTLIQKHTSRCDACQSVTVDFVDEYVNSCSRPVQCTMRWELRYATSAADYQAGASQVKKWHVDTTKFLPNNRVTRRVTLAESAPHRYGYWWTAPVTPSGTYEGFTSNYYACQWAD